MNIIYQFFYLILLSIADILSFKSTLDGNTLTTTTTDIITTTNSTLNVYVVKDDNLENSEMNFQNLVDQYQQIMLNVDEFHLSNNIYFKNDTEIISISENSTIIYINNSSLTPYFTISVSSKIKFEGILFTDNKLESSLVVIKKDSKLQIKNCKFDTIDSKSSIISVYEAELTLENVDFKNCNSAYKESNIYADTSHIKIINSSFSNNQNGIFKLIDTDFRITSAIFNQNQAEDGSCLYATFSNIQFNNTDFINNNASNDGGVIWLDNSNLSLNNVKMKDNNALRDGGTIYSKDANLELYAMTFENNIASNGGCLYCLSCHLNIEFCHFSNGHAKLGTGGVLYLDSNDINISTSYFTNNIADMHGGVSYIYKSNLIISNSSLNDNNVNYFGGVFCISKSIISIYQSEFINNTSGNDGGVIYISDSKVSTFNTNFISNKGRSGGVLYLYNKSQFYSEMCLFYYNEASEYGGSTYLSAVGTPNSVLFKNCVSNGNKASVGEQNYYDASPSNNVLLIINDGSVNFLQY